MYDAARRRAVVPTTSEASVREASSVSKNSIRSISGSAPCAMPATRYALNSSGATSRSRVSPMFIIARSAVAMFTRSCVRLSTITNRSAYAAADEAVTSIGTTRRGDEDEEHGGEESERRAEPERDGSTIPLPQYAKENARRQ